jgi:hypothetical protein
MGYYIETPAVHGKAQWIADNYEGEKLTFLKDAAAKVRANARAGENSRETVARMSREGSL